MLASRITTVLLLALVALFGLHLLAGGLDGMQADLTGDQLYSLTPGTLQILERMQKEGVKPVTVKLYFSESAGKTLPKFIKEFVTYERYVESLLEEYELRSGGKLRVETIDPVPDSDEAQDAIDFGLDGKPINQQGDRFFFGLVFETQTGSRDVIDFLWPDRQEAIEYEISKRIHSLLWPSGKRIAVLSSLEVGGTADNPYLAQMLAMQGKQPRPKWTILRLLEETYQATVLPEDSERISHDDYELVIVVHPKELPAKAVWALDEWVATGGNALLLLDPYSIADQPPQNPQQPWLAFQYKPSSNLPQLLSAWGLERPEDRIAADFDLATRRRVDAAGPGEAVLVDLGIGEETRAATLAAGQPIVQGLADLRFFMAGSLVQKGEAPPGVSLTPLVTTTAAGNTLEIKPGFGDEGLVFADVNRPARLADRFSPGTSPVVLAYLVQGRLPSAFPQGTEFPSQEAARPPGLPPGIDLPPPEGALMVRKEPVPETARKEASVVVFADVDFVTDPLGFQQVFGIVQAANDNHKLLLNAVDYLLGAPELMSVRAKRKVARPFTLFDEIEAAAEKETLERERQIRADVEQFQKELQEKQGAMTQKDAALFEKRLRDEVDQLNEQIRERNRELFEIRKARRSKLEGEEAKVRLAVLGWMPAVVLALGLGLAGRRRLLARRAQEVGR